MIRWFAQFLCFVVSSCSGIGQAARPSRGEVDGTYEIMMCRGDCDAALVRGHLVLEAHPYPLDSVPQSALSYFRRYEPYLLIGDAENTPNACFVLDLARGARTYAGISPVGLSRWTIADAHGQLAVPLYHSSDAGYLARITIRAGQLRGHGRSWGGHGEAAAFPIDSIVGRRVGPPDRSLCLRAAEAESTELRNRP